MTMLEENINDVLTLITRDKDALLKAIVENDYTDIINFYYFKICDSIYELDIVPYLEKKNKEETEYKIAGYKPRINEVYLKEHGSDHTDDEPDDSDMKIYEFKTK